MLCIVGSPPTAYGVTWWNSRKPPGPPPDRAPPPVPQPDRPFYLGRNVPRSGGRRATPARTVRGGTLLPGEILQECCQSPRNNLIQIAVRNLVAQQVLRQPQLLIRFRRRGELHLVASWRHRGHRRRPSLWRGGGGRPRGRGGGRKPRGGAAGHGRGRRGRG